MATKATQPVPDWQRLQRKIFTRWVNQKLTKKNITVKDIVDEMATGLVLVALMEVLAEKTFAGKMDKNPKLKPNKIDNCTQALKFTWECGVEMKLKPSPEDLHDGNMQQILGLIWAIMTKYVKIGDEEDTQSLNAKDALLLWAKNQVAEYPSIPTLEKFGKEWHDGMALAAILHKHRPKLLDFHKLNKDNKIENLKLVQDAAERYFSLEKYISADDIPKLDENSMFVYVSEFYYGIAEQRKLDLAAKRIGKVVKLTIENDAMKKEFNETAQAFKERLTRVEKVLEDRSIDNTMEGAKRRIGEFYDYKTKDKNVLLGNQLDLEAVYNNLAMRLSHHKRPEFIPPSGLTLKDIAKAVQHLEECEQERKVALHAELNRQIRLVQLNDQHKSRYQQLKSWYDSKAAYLKTREVIESVSAAELQLRLHDAYEKEKTGVEGSNIVHLKKLSEELVKEKYEKSADVQARDQEIHKNFEELDGLSKAKRPVLEDALSREKFKEKVRLMNQEHINNYNKLAAWIADKEAYLKTREEIHSVSEARTQLSLFDGYEKENQSNAETSVVELKTLGADILASKYETQYSKWSIENPEQIGQRESTVDNKWKELADLAAEKKRVLDDHLAREEFAERVRMMKREHESNYDKLASWIAEKEAYLNTREKINSVSEARTQLNIFSAYEKENESVLGSNVVELKALGAKTLSSKYETKYSKWSIEQPEDITNKESTVDNKWKELADLAAEKKRVLDDHLAREEFAEKTRMMNQEHINNYNKLAAWIADKEAYLNTREEIHSVSEARTQLNLFDAYERENKSVSSTQVVELKSLGAKILASKYETKYSKWSIEKPEQIGQRESTVDNKWKGLADFAAEKKRVLDDHLAREEFAEKTRSMNQVHINSYDKLAAWIADKEAYLNTREEIHSVSEARTQLNLFDAYERENQSVKNSRVVELKSLGAQILASKYETKYSKWSIENPEQIGQRESTVDNKWKELSDLAAEKKRVLDDHLAREEFAERVRMMNRNHVDRYNKLINWNTEKEAYLKTKEVVDTVAAARTQLSRLDAFDKEKQRMSDLYVTPLNKLGADTLAQKYETKYSKYVFENPAEIKDRESDISSKWGVLAQLSVEKRKVLDADLVRELEKERLRMEFASLASDFERFTKDSVDEVNVTNFGFTLEEVTEFKKSLDKSNGDIKSHTDSKQNAYTDVHKKMIDMGVKDNVYTTHTLDTLASARSGLEAAVQKRNAAYDTELARQKANDQLCRDFAGVADPFVKSLLDAKDHITQSKAELEEQLKYVHGKIAALTEEVHKLKPVHDLNGKIEAAGIVNNKYTLLTAKDVEVQWEQYKAFLNKKEKMLVEEIEHHKLRGVTPEQFKEIESTFKQFDTDNSGHIDKKELKACLYSLGEEKTKSEIEAIFDKYGSKDVNGIKYNSFKDFMIDLLGVSDTKDDILNSFKLINKGEEVAKLDKMELVMDEKDLEYIKKTAAQVGGGYNYKAWTEEVFAR